MSPDPSPDAPLDTFDPASDLDAVTRLISIAFASPIDGCKTWLELGGHSNLRVLRGGASTPEACLLRIPMGQYFGGRSVPMIGIAGVAVGPESRGRGLARQLMQRAIKDAAREGVPLMTLYASTQTLYRQVGFEQAGGRFRIRVPMAWIDIRERDGQVIPLTEAHEPALRDCYAKFARHFDGMLDRGAYIWQRIRKNRGVESLGFGIQSPDGTLEGYLFFNQPRLDSGRHDLVITDLAFTTARAAGRLLGFVADFGSMADHAEFFGGPSHPVLILLNQQRYTVSLKDYWMLRILDVKEALEARGYHPTLAGEVHIQMEDPLLEHNNGPWILRVAGGRATVVSGGRGELRVGPRGLAALYSGFASATSLMTIGLCQGSPAALAAADGLLSGRSPWMNDFF